MGDLIVDFLPMEFLFLFSNVPLGLRDPNTTGDNGFTSSVSHLLIIVHQFLVSTVLKLLFCCNNLQSFCISSALLKVFNVFKGIMLI